MEKQLKELIRTIGETRLIERLMNAGSTEERLRICNEAGGSKEFENFNLEFAKKMEAQKKEDKGYIFEDGTKIVTQENAVQIAFICIISGIDDCDLLEDFNQLACALREVSGPMETLAIQIARIIGDEPGEDCDMFSDYDLPVLLDMIF